jgi:hypothetical protein
MLEFQIRFFSRAELIINILLPTKPSYSNSIERSNSLLGGCIGDFWV